nr:hypothetical protein [Tanacetum cinerariifolium]
YPNVQENLKLTVEEHVILEEPASSTGTLYSLQHLAKDFSFGNLFFNDKPFKADNEKTTAETEAELMVSVTIQQDTSAIPPMTTPVIDLTSKPNSPNAHRPLQATVTETTTTTTTTHAPPPQLQQSTIDFMLIKRITRKKKKKRRDSPKTPPGSPPHQPPPPPHQQEGQSHGFTAPSSLKTDATAEYTAWTTYTRLRPSVSSIPKVLHMDDDMAPDAQVHLSDDEDIGNAHIPKINLQQNWWKLFEEDKPATPEPVWSIPSYDLPVPMNNWASTKGGKPTLSISKMKVAYYPDVSLEQMVPDQMWIEEECKHTSEGDRKAVQTHMRILNVVRIKVFSMYGSLKPSTTQRQEDSYYCSQLMDQTLGQLNLTKPRWDATGFEYKYDFTIIDSLRAVKFRDKYGVQMIMRFNKIYKFSDGTLHQINEALDYEVKEFKVNRMNLGLNTRFWTRKDVDRSKEFMFAIQKRLKTRRIFSNLESFVDGRVRDGDYRLLQRTE